MTQEEKQLLLKDLCARLPYGVIINAPSNIFYPTNREDIKLDSVFEIDGNFHVSEDYGWPIETCKPYLRPLSSMTEEEQTQLGRLIGAASYNMLKGDYSSLRELLEYVYKNHIDLFGLIPKGLALEAPEGIYNT